MASLQQKGDRWYCQFVYQGKRSTFPVGNVSEEEANAKAAQVDYILLRLKQRLIKLPPGVSIVDFIQFDGRPEQLPPQEKTTLAELQAKYLDAHKKSLEETTLKGIRIHFKHLKRILGEKYPIPELDLAKLQEYANKRAEEDGLHGRTVAAATIKKEIVTLRTMWNWGLPMKLVTGKFPNKGLQFEKEVDKLPFMTMNEIERRIAGGGLSDAEIVDLWDSLYLTVDEIAELLQHIKTEAIQPFVYPMSCFGAYTGARRSEMIRVRVTDLDFEQNIVTIHEKKRVKGRLTTRRVPLSPFLRDVLKNWLATHPGGQYLFCQGVTVARSKKRSPTTGHKGQSTRAKTASGRSEMVKQRNQIETGSLTPDEAHDHFKRALGESKWKVIGLHALRHSFISACASKNIDQRVIEEWSGHMDAQTSRRYRHLYPNVQQDSMISVFGREKRD